MYNRSLYFRPEWCISCSVNTGTYTGTFIAWYVYILVSSLTTKKLVPTTLGVFQCKERLVFVLMCKMSLHIRPEWYTCFSVNTGKYTGTCSLVSTYTGHFNKKTGAYHSGRKYKDRMLFILMSKGPYVYAHSGIYVPV